MPAALSLRSITKTFGTLTAVDAFSLEVARGTIFALLGPNGAGKTTIIKILTTLMRPTAGSAQVEGFDVQRDGKQVRRLIGVVPQENNLDRYLTCRENLVLQARLHGMAPAGYNRRIDELLELVGLSGRQGDFPDTFSGGMQRRLVVARALVHRPRVLFLDEPTTGLDPQSRRAVWEYVESLKDSMTIFLTTHYMDEADALCDRIVIMDHGRALVDGTAAELKERLAHAHLYELQFRAGSDRYEALLRSFPFVRSLQRTGDIFRLALTGEEYLKPLLDAIGNEDIRKLCLREPSLEDVFIELTGREVRE
ncbi:daunorubicin resistance protein DrrA family ABC transporter ATP-binding protein [Geotalea uraniireducens]|uniref:Daunorubicin resistance protein DrrA family ABC transporter ATP-binding protein n=1 Tax=Geotalea uraniireducens TaxID=351604 RepID=A0ABM8EQY4_9BACT|nr:ATP-binding cassette domain-containing protein [Geotalea uraniireducens]BDV44927.1 daunorubicin resistance protein DrrA family ABC transporter ATP-binding protein [Geotalea uraniireducens]